jgi:hypothetical protein
VASAGDAEPGLVDAELAVRLGRRATTVRGRPCFEAAQYGPDPGLQHSGLDGFDHVVVRSGFESDHDVHVVALGGHHDDRHLAVRADPAARLQPAHPGQHQIQHHDVRPERPQLNQPLLPGLGRRDVVPLATRGQPGTFTDTGVVFDEEDTRHALSIDGVRQSIAALLRDDHIVDVVAVRSYSQPGFDHIAGPVCTFMSTSTWTHLSAAAVKGVAAAPCHDGP